MDEVSEMGDGDEGEEEEGAEGEDEGLPLSQRRRVAHPVRSLAQERNEDETEKRPHAQSDAHPLFRDPGCVEGWRKGKIVIFAQ